MSDIVERLRPESATFVELKNAVNTMREAADEIERLRAALEKIEKTVAWGYPDRWETTPAEVRQLARRALEDKDE